MANELHTNYNGARPVYATIRKDDTTVRVEATGTFVPWIESNRAQYAHYLENKGGNFFARDLPVGTPADWYTFYYFEQAGAAPSDNDFGVSERVYWTGEEIVSELFLGSHYASVDEIKNYKIAGVKALPEGMYTDQEIESRIRLAEAIIESITNDFFLPKERTVIFEYDDFIMLNNRLLTVDSVKELDYKGEAVHTFAANDWFNQGYYLKLASGSSCCGRKGVRDFFGPAGRRCDSGGVDMRRLAVKGTWGRTGVPPQIKEATILLALEKLLPGSTKMIPDGVVQAVWTDFTVTFKADKKESKTTGYAGIDVLLQDFISFANFIRVV